MPAARPQHQAGFDAQRERLRQGQNRKRKGGNIRPKPFAQRKRCNCRYARRELVEEGSTDQ